MWILSPPTGNNHLATPWAMQTNMTKTKPFVFSKVDLLPGPHFGLWPYHLLKLKSQAPCCNLPFPSASTANDFSRPLDFTSETTNQFPCPLPCYQVSPVCDLFSHLLPKFLQQTSTWVPACYSTALNRLVQQSTYFTEQSRIFHSLCMDWKCGWRLKACSLWSSSASTLVDSCEASVREMDITWKGWGECHA